MDTLKQVADDILENLLKQNKRSVSDDTKRPFGAPSCLYLSPEGHRCGVGWRIKPEHYVPEIEGSSINTLLFAEPSEEDKSKVFLRRNSEGSKYISFESLELIRQDLAIDGIGFPETEYFYSTVQGIHDNSDPEDWPQYFFNLIYDKYNIEVPEFLLERLKR